VFLQVAAILRGSDERGLILVNANPEQSSKLPIICRIHERGCAMYEFLHETVADNMTRRVRSVTPETTVGDLYRLFAADDFDAYPVVRDDTLVGVVSKLDALNVFALAEDQILPHLADGMGATVDQIMTTDVITVEPETNLQRVLQRMVAHRLKSLPVIDKRRNLVGIIAREDIMRAMERWALRQQPPIVPFEQA
jgi:CBS-domain-containing membrane protein